ncbi:alpha/beta hydrolase [uncultured Amnibacterium sp.]|uniref:alpha/beta hydrolase n=1 Tax=uncultured Amnibacterium sp. TaxID=1631851 RepID=UPI0035C99794
MPGPSNLLRAVAAAPIGRLEGRRLLVLLHGYGADEHDLLPVGEVLRGDDAVVSLRGPAAVGAGASWVDGPPASVPAGAGLAPSVQAVLATLDAIVETAGTPSAVRLLGFSQGGALALELLRAEPDRFDRVVVLAGFVSASPSPGDAGLAESRPAVFWGRGDADQVIPPDAVARTAAWLDANAEAVVRVYAGLAHGITPEELGDVAAFLV